MAIRQPATPDVKFHFVEARNGLYNVYANNIHALWTNHDVRIKFGELIKITEASSNSPRVFTVEERASVTMAWTEAKFLANMLAGIVSQFEELNGEIKTPTIA